MPIVLSITIKLQQLFWSEITVTNYCVLGYNHCLVITLGLHYALNELRTGIMRLEWIIFQANHAASKSDIDT